MRPSPWTFQIDDRRGDFNIFFLIFRPASKFFSAENAMPRRVFATPATKFFSRIAGETDRSSNLGRTGRMVIMTATLFVLSRHIGGMGDLTHSENLSHIHEK
jgi:hypothetical protein